MEYRGIEVIALIHRSRPLFVLFQEQVVKEIAQSRRAPGIFSKALKYDWVLPQNAEGKILMKERD